MEKKDRALRSCISDRRYLNAHFSTKLWVSAGPISVGFLMVLTNHSMSHLVNCVFHLLVNADPEVKWVVGWRDYGLLICKELKCKSVLTCTFAVL